MKLEALKELGLSEGQVSVYSAVLELGISNLNQIHEKTGIERRNIYDILNKLIEKGLISYTVENKKRKYQCTHPNKILEEINQKEKTLEELKLQMPQIKDLFMLSKPDIRAEVYRGNEAIKSFLNEVLEYKESYWLGGNNFNQRKAVPESLILWFTQWMKRRIEKKHMMYDLIQYGTMLEGLYLKDFEKQKKSFLKVQKLPEELQFPLVIVIFGNKVAQILWAEQSFAFILESKEIKESFMKYFKYFWKKDNTN